MMIINAAIVAGMLLPSASGFKPSFFGQMVNDVGVQKKLESNTCIRVVEELVYALEVLTAGSTLLIIRLQLTKVTTTKRMSLSMALRNKFSKTHLAS